MAKPIQQLFTLCKQIFGKYSVERLDKDILEPIISSLNKITHNDIGFFPDRYEQMESRKRNPAPVSYMELYRDDQFTMALFVVKRGTSLPLHDHPNMFGLLKLIHGSICLVSYDDISASSEMNYRTKLRNFHSSTVNNSGMKSVIRNPDKILSSDDGCCLLTPKFGNIHEIQPLSSFSAFLDVLYPSYGNHTPCNYYQELEKLESPANSDSDKNEKWLMRISEPNTYWCDSLSYEGPPLE